MFSSGRRFNFNFYLDFYSIVAILICVAISQLLRLCAFTLSLPLWLDLTGIIVATALGGLVPGIIAAVLNQIVLAVIYHNGLSLLYIFPVVVVVILMNLCLRNGYIKNFLSLAGLFFLVLTIYSLFCSAISMAAFNGYTSYAPIDNLFSALMNRDANINRFFASFTMRFYASFFDFIVSLLLSSGIYTVLDRYTPFNFR